MKTLRLPRFVLASSGSSMCWDAKVWKFSVMRVGYGGHRLKLSTFALCTVISW